MNNSARSKLFTRSAVVDIMTALVVICMISGMYFKYSSAKIALPFTKSNEVEMVLFCPEVPEFSAQTIKPGDIVRNPEKEVVFGHVTDIRLGKSISYAESDTGESTVSAKPGYASIYITVVGKGIIGDGRNSTGVTFGNLDFWFGKPFDFKAGNTAMFGFIYDVKKKG